MRAVTIGLVVALAVAACGDSDSSESADPSPADSPAEPQEAAPADLPTPIDVEVTSDLAYGEDRPGFHPALLDVYVPVVAEGEEVTAPWPVVVMFHGGGGQFQDKLGVADMATLVAAKGAVVFAPNTGGPSDDPNARDIRILEDAGQSCATSVALDRAAEFGGDPEQLTLAGFSGGANAAMFVTQATEPPGADHCLVTPTPVEPDQLVLWEGDYFLAPWWDDALEANPDVEISLWDDIDPDTTSTWHLMLGDPDRVAPQRLPVGDPFGSGDECDRPVGEEPAIIAAGGMCRYFALRDPDAGLRRDADALGHFDDGFFSIGEFSLLLEKRLEDAGIEVTTTVVPGATHNDLTGDGRSAMIDLIAGTT